MNVYYLIGMLGMFGLGYQVGTALERIRWRERLSHVRFFRMGPDGGLVPMDEDEEEDEVDGEG